MQRRPSTVRDQNRLRLRSPMGMHPLPPTAQVAVWTAKIRLSHQVSQHRIARPHRIRMQPMLRMSTRTSTACWMVDRTSQRHPRKKPKVGTAVAEHIMKRPAAARDATLATFDRSSPPKFGTECPCVFNKCRIYETPTKFRAVPAPDRSVYDKSFPFKATTKKAAWDTLIAYCRDPFIPKDSKNYVKIGKF